MVTFTAKKNSKAKIWTAVVEKTDESGKRKGRETNPPPPPPKNGEYYTK